MAFAPSTSGTVTMTERLNLQQGAFVLLRITLGVVFVYASIEKLADPSAFATSISAYKVLAGTSALVVATILPWVELLCGAGLLFGVYVKGSSTIALVLLLGFTAAVLSALVRGLDIACGCYTQDPSARHIGYWKVGENAVLLVVAFLVMRLSRSSHNR